MSNLKDVISTLKSARNKCVDTVDKSTLKKIDLAINRLESELKMKRSQARLIVPLNILIMMTEDETDGPFFELTETLKEVALEIISEQS